MKRITRARLEHMIRIATKAAGVDLQLDHIACYGGYNVESPTGHVLNSGRMTARECDYFLAGMIEAAWRIEQVKEGIAQ